MAPTQVELKAVFAALVGNGLDFFERSAREIDKDQKFAIAHFAIGLELILKARLFHEHWTLISTEPHKCAWSTVKSGTVHTLAASDLCAAITTTTGTPLTHEARAFKTVFEHRNRVLHWTPQLDLAVTVAEQCLAWHFLRQLLTGAWIDAFGEFAQGIARIEAVLRAHRTYLDVKFRQIEPRLRGFAKQGLILECPSCEFTAGVAEKSVGRIHSFDCQLCGYSSIALRSHGGELEERSRQEMLDELDPPPTNIRPKEMAFYEPDRAHCGECSSIRVTVTQDGPDYVCVACGCRFEPDSSSRCDWCNTRWFGWDAEHSHYTGCELCDGPGLGSD